MPRVASQVCARRRGWLTEREGHNGFLIRRRGGELTQNLAALFAGAWPAPLVTRRGGGREDASVSGGSVVSVSRFGGVSHHRVGRARAQRF
eukprot:3445595-Prymnesium_polylepis.1